MARKDNKIVTLLSSYAGALPVTKVNRFDRITKGKIDITCPFIVQENNKHMGGVDLMDSFLGRNHITMRSKKWYLRIFFFHLFDLSIVNSWIVYKKNSQEVNLKRVCLQWANSEMNWPLYYATEEPPKKLKEGVGVVPMVEGVVPVY